ncbi:MAG: hypothetical protein ACYTX0_62835, partial [Nostoc sp.]
IYFASYAQNYLQIAGLDLVFSVLPVYSDIKVIGYAKNVFTYTIGYNAQFRKRSHLSATIQLLID